MSNHFTITPRSLDIYTEGDGMIAWRASEDLGFAIESGSNALGAALPTSAEGGYVLVGLNIDGEDTITSIVTTERLGVDGAPIRIVDEAILALTTLRNALAKIGQ